MKGAEINAALRFLTPLVGLHCVWVRGEGGGQVFRTPTSLTLLFCLPSHVFN